MYNNAIKKHNFFNHKIIGQFFRYFWTGGLAFIVDFGLFSIATYCFNIHYLITNLMGLIGGSIVNYLLCIRWVFSSEKRTLEKHKFIEIIVFFLIGLLGMALNELLMYCLVEIFILPKVISKMVATAIVLFYNFFARKFVLF